MGRESTCFTAVSSRTRMKPTQNWICLTAEQNLLQFLQFQSIHLRRLKPLRRILSISRSPQVLATTTSINTRTLQMSLIRRVPCCLPCRHQTTNWSTRNHLSLLGAMRTSRLPTHSNLLIQLISNMSLIWLSWKSVSL